jgi:hypothetical protein
MENCLPAEFARKVLAALLRSTGDDDAGAFGNEAPRGRLADAAGRARNDGNFPLQSSRHRRSLDSLHPE